MAKKNVKAKEPIKMRFRTLANGAKSIYLDCYQDGKREYEFLNMYLNAGNDPITKTQNNEVLRVAELIKAERTRELLSGNAGLSTARSRAKMRLSEWMSIYREYRKKHGRSNSRANKIEQTRKHLIVYYGDNVRLCDIDKKYCEGFIEYLKGCKGREGKMMAITTQKTNWRTFAAALNKAVKDEILLSNPTQKVDKEDLPKVTGSTREFLTAEEVGVLSGAKCANDIVKRAFLFSCFCGLRYSDVAGLKWANVQEISGREYIVGTMQKTKQKIHLPLSKMALEQIPERGKARDDERIFALPCYSAVARDVKKWVEGCGISKKVTFHVSRHTFATLTLSVTSDLYVVSKLLGHTDIKTTEIYAKVLDAAKVSAVDALEGIFTKK